MPETKLTATEFFDKVEEEWFRLMQGELMLEETPSLAALALHMRAEAQVNVEITRGAVEQFDGQGALIEGDVPEQEYARRVAEALAVLFYGTTPASGTTTQREE